MEKEIEINGKKFTVKELKYKDITSLSNENQAETAKTLLVNSTGITEEEFNELTMREGIQIQKAVNEVNGLQDFQKPLAKQE